MTHKNKKLSYIIITPAHNEEAYIEQTIKSVISQTHLPEKWVIVSDGSTDGTDDIIKKYLKKHPWIDYVRRPEHLDRQFAAKVHCFNAGYEVVKDSEYDIIGNLDADITFDEEYFDFLMSKFNGSPRLGVAGTPFVEGTQSYDYRFTNIEHVSGACQLFRRECFDEIGGYIPIKGGGIDWTAVTMARMKGWKTRTYTEKTCFHHKKMGTGNNSALVALFKHGKKDYFLGGHPAWQIFRACYQLTVRPYILSGVLLLSGYTWGFLSGVKRPIPQELVKFHRAEQMARLKETFKKALGLKK